MKKTAILLSAFVIIAGGCGNRKQAGSGDIPADSIQVQMEENDMTLNDDVDNKSELLYEDVKDYMLNGKNHKVAYKYCLHTHPTTDKTDEHYGTKSSSLTVYFDDKEIYAINSAHIGLSSADPDWEYFDENANFNKNAAKNEIIELFKRKNPYGMNDNLTTITNDGIEYLIFTIRDTGDNMFAISSSFINDSGTVLHTEWNNLCIFDVFKESITNSNYIKGDKKMPFYIKDNKYYNVEMNCSWPDDYVEGEPYTCTIYEKTLTIKQNKVNQEKREINTITLYGDFCQ
jgi:hypothetical protein